MVIGTSATDGWAGTFGTVRTAWARQTTDQRPVYQLHIIRCGTVIKLYSKGLKTINAN